MKVGTASSIINVNFPIQLAGHKGPRVSNQIGDNLLIRSIYFQSDSERIVIISIELLWLDKFQVNYIKNKVAQILKIDVSDILLCCSHTHSGPDTLNWYEFAPPVDENWLKSVLDQAIETATAAINKLHDVEMGCLKDSLDISINRRLFIDGEVFLKPNPHGKTSSAFHIIRFINEQKKIVAVIFHHIAHPVVLGKDSLVVSSDWCGMVCKNVEQELNCLCVYLSGSAGDQNPKIWTNNSYDSMLEMAHQVSSKVLELLKSRDYQLMNDLTLEVLSKEKTAIGKPHPYLIKAYEKRIDIDKGITYCVQLLKIGNLFLVSCPGECLIDTGEYIIQEKDWTLMVSYSNDYLGYFPMPHIYKEGGYEPYATMLTSDDVLEYADCCKDMLNNILK